jgi:hypothetical protein
MCYTAGMRSAWILSLLLLGILAATWPVQAQDEESTGLQYGLTVTGQISNSAPRVAYFFEALRCDILSVQLRATSGNLDPVLTIVDDTGTAILTRDDSEGVTDVFFEPLSIPHSGRYYVVVGRFGYGLGSTSGGFELTIERIGNGSAYGCAMRYGDTVTNTITNMTPQMYYSFRARQGDVITTSMRRLTGDLDAYLQIVDGDNYVLDFNDDIPGSGTQDAEIQALVIPEDGTYYIVATRYGLAAGTSTGSFVLTLDEADGSGLRASPQTALVMRPGQTLEGEIDATVSGQYYRFEAQQDQLITVSMERLGGDLDPFLVLADAGMREIVSDDDSGPGNNALISDFLIPADGTYYLLATRHDREIGTTSGRYRLSLQSAGLAFAGVPDDIRRLSYGMTVTGIIDDGRPEALYVFWGQAGDTLTISMNQADGNLDSLVRLLAADRQTVLVSDDDSGPGNNAYIERFTLPATGVYYIQATRFIEGGMPPTAGGYVLVLAQRFD